MHILCTLHTPENLFALCNILKVFIISSEFRRERHPLVSQRWGWHSPCSHTAVSQAWGPLRGGQVWFVMQSSQRQDLPTWTGVSSDTYACSGVNKHKENTSVSYLSGPILPAWVLVTEPRLFFCFFLRCTEAESTGYQMRKQANIMTHSEQVKL